MCRGPVQPLAKPALVPVPKAPLDADLELLLGALPPPPAATAVAAAQPAGDLAWGDPLLDLLDTAELLPLDDVVDQDFVDLWADGAALSPFDDATTPDNNDDDQTTATGGAKACARRRRKRKLACELSPDELVRMRQANRAAARRHRNLSKEKMVEKEQYYAELGERNAALRGQVAECQARVAELKALVASLVRSGRLPLASS